MPEETDLGGLGLSDFELFWDAAARNVPIMVVGGGRWGRVWLQVLADARGSTRDLIWVARTDHAEAMAWARANPAVASVAGAPSIAAGLSLQRPTVAIIASRPRDHVSDAQELLAAGAHVLVEKPISPAYQDVERLLRQASGLNLRLGIGCEFALLPAFQTLRELLGPPTADEVFDLEWCDPDAELRHGAVKARHDEITILEDLLPHAWSVFRAMRPHARFSLAAAKLQDGGNSGRLEFSDQNGARYTFTCDRSAAARRRYLLAASNGHVGSVDFARHPPIVRLNDRLAPLSPKAVALASVLRIEIGAFVAETSGLSTVRPLTTGLDDLVALQAELENA